MNCDCVEKINERLKEAGYEYRLAVSFVFDNKMNMTSRLELPTIWNDVTKRKKKSPPSILCTLCPFCGKPTAPVKVESQSEVQEGTK